MSNLTCILRRKGNILLNRADETVICGQAIVEGYLRKGFTFDWAATDEARARDTAARATPSQRLDAATVERLTRIRTSMALLQQNSEGCALNHYGSDAETHGLPGWLEDTKRDLEALTDLLATEPHQHGGKGA